ncbi:hypothetical protein GYB61_09265 [bacterium]|nr:hypothetical protein [bacterium]
MKGMVFTEFLELVEDRFGLEDADAIIEASGSEHGGSYTAVGNYDYKEMVHMVVALSERSGIAIEDLLHVFGEHLFTVFHRKYGNFFEGVESAIEFLGSIEDTIHVEVRKLYPDAELPSFAYPERSDTRLIMDYQSTRPLAHFAYGLINGCVKHFGAPLKVEMQDLSDGAGTHARFTLEQAAA